MLNCCIEKKLHREQDSRSQKKTPLPSVSSANSEIQIADPVTADPVTSEDTTTPPDRPISVASGSDSDEFFDTEEAVDNDSAIPGKIELCFPTTFCSRENNSYSY